MTRCARPAGRCQRQRCLTGFDLTLLQDDSLRSPYGSLPGATLSHYVRLDPAAGSHPSRFNTGRLKRKKHPEGAFLLNLVGRAGFEPATN